jgi:hypothetical protein
MLVIVDLCATWGEMGMFKQMSVILTVVMVGGAVQAAELEIPHKKNKVAPGYERAPVANMHRDNHVQVQTNSKVVAR